MLTTDPHMPSPVRGVFVVGEARIQAVRIEGRRDWAQAQVGIWRLVAGRTLREVATHRLVALREVTA